MHWYLVYTKPKQEKCALENLERQGYECYLPMLPAEKVRQGVLTIEEEPLFPRYLFIRLGQGATAKSWSPIRSTKGVSQLVSFGLEPTKIEESLVELLKSQEYGRQSKPQRLFIEGDRVRLIGGPFAGLEGIYQMAEGERRVIVLIELLTKQTSLKLPLLNLDKVG